MHRFIAAAVALVLAGFAGSAMAATLTNEDVVTLTQKLPRDADGKLGKDSEDLIVKSITTSDCRFDVSPEQIVKLTEAKVPIRIISLMIDTNKAAKNRVTGMVQVALQGFKDNDAKQTDRALRDLKALGADAIVEIDRQGLTSDSAAVRAGSAEAIGLIGHRDGIEPLYRALIDREAEVRAAAAKALRALVTDRDAAKTRLVDMLGNIDQPRDGAALALGQLKETRALPELRKLADPSNSPQLRTAAITAIGLMADKDSVELLIKCLLPDKPGDYNIEVSSASAMSLARIGDAKAVKPMLKAFERYPAEAPRLVGPLSRFRDPLVIVAFIDALDNNVDAANAGGAKTSDLAWEALKMLTGRDMEKSRQAWNDWWEIDGKKRF